MRFTPDNTNGIEAEAFASTCSGIDVVRPGAAKCQQGCFVLFFSLYQVVFELAPLVTANLAIRKVFTFNI